MDDAYACVRVLCPAEVFKALKWFRTYENRAKKQHNTAAEVLIEAQQAVAEVQELARKAAINEYAKAKHVEVAAQAHARIATIAANVQLAATGRERQVEFSALVAEGASRVASTMLNVGFTVAKGTVVAGIKAAPHVAAAAMSAGAAMGRAVGAAGRGSAGAATGVARGFRRSGERLFSMGKRMRGSAEQATRSAGALVAYMGKTLGSLGGKRRRRSVGQRRLSVGTPRAGRDRPIDSSGAVAAAGGDERGVASEGAVPAGTHGLTGGLRQASSSGALQELEAGTRRASRHIFTHIHTYVYVLLVMQCPCIPGNAHAYSAPLADTRFLALIIAFVVCMCPCRPCRWG